ncbi:hypothetical protein BD414DRAFT_535019 [Trametes punicea]|nr:hypothetical protein BD414DRAFT_535019 [Trametes punicea]
MILLTVLITSLFALTGVFQSLSVDTFLSALSLAFTTPTLSALYNVFHLAGPAPRPTLPVPVFDISTGSPFSPFKDITSDYSSFDPILDLTDSILDDSPRPQSSLAHIHYRSYFGLPAVFLVFSLVLFSWHLYRAMRSAITAPKSLQSELLKEPASLYDLDISGFSPAISATSSIYEHLFESSTSELAFEPITDPVDMVDQLNNVFVANTTGCAIIDLGHGQHLFAPFDSNELHILDTGPMEDETLHIYEEVYVEEDVFENGVLRRRLWITSSPVSCLRLHSPSIHTFTSPSAPFVAQLFVTHLSPEPL